MPNSLFGIFFLLVLVGAGVLAALTYSAHLYSISELTAGTFGSRLETYSNVDLGLSVRYPVDFAVNPDYIYVGFLNHDHQVRGISFTVPKKTTEGTNLSPDTRFSVEVIPNQPSCSATLFLPDAKYTEGIVEHGVSYTYATHEEGAAGNKYEEHVYALTRASPCVAVRYFIHYTNIGNYAPGAVEEFDRKNLLSVFDTMRGTLAVKQ